MNEFTTSKRLAEAFRSEATEIFRGCAQPPRPGIHGSPQGIVHLAPFMPLGTKWAWLVKGRMFVIERIEEDLWRGCAEPIEEGYRGLEITSVFEDELL